MRINRYVASSVGIGRRQADKLIARGHVKVDGQLAVDGLDVKDNQVVTLDNKQIVLPSAPTTIMLNKPVGYVVSRKGQGSKTIYALLPSKHQQLKAIGRLDKESSGLLIMTNDGDLAQQLAHPSYNKQKTYQVSLNRNISEQDKALLIKGVQLDDGLSKVEVKEHTGNFLVIGLSEGRNRQIRRTFQAIGYQVTKLKRTNFGKYSLGKLKVGHYREITP